METVVYRKDEGTLGATGSGTVTTGHCISDSGLPEAPLETCALHPELFYPLLFEREFDVWAHWLPTASVFSRVNRTFPSDLTNMLTRLHAPPEVLEELRWSCLMELFDAYEIRMPQRRAIRDPAASSTF